MTAPSGVGLWSAYIGGVDPAKIVAFAQARGVKWLALKAGDAHITPAWRTKGRAILRAARDAGLSVYSWHYSVPGRTGDEIALMREAYHDGISGHIIDAEQEWTGQHASAQDYVDAVRAALPGVWLAHAPFALPVSHRDWPYAAFNTLDAVMPQLYWTEFNRLGMAANAARAEAQWAQAWPAIVPWFVGVTYGSGTAFGKPPGQLVPSDVDAFLARYSDRPVSMYSYEADQGLWRP